MGLEKNLELRRRLFLKFINMLAYDAVAFVFKTRFCLSSVLCPLKARSTPLTYSRFCKMYQSSREVQAVRPKGFYVVQMQPL